MYKGILSASFNPSIHSLTPTAADLKRFPTFSKGLTASSHLTIASLAVLIYGVINSKNCLILSIGLILFIKSLTALAHFLIQGTAFSAIPSKSIRLSIQLENLVNALPIADVRSQILRFIASSILETIFTATFIGPPIKVLIKCNIENNP